MTGVTAGDRRPDPWVAFGGGDLHRHLRELRRVHETAAGGGDSLGSPVLRPTIRSSWQRSAAEGVRPEGHGAPALVDTAEAIERRAVHPLARTLPALRELLRSGADEPHHLMVVSDARGMLLWVEGPPHDVSRAADDMNFVPGSDWSEAGVGTNAIGTALAADHAIQVLSAEHYSAACHRWTCSGAPVHDPATGQVLGAIDITTGAGGYHPIGYRLVRAAARVVEGLLAEDLRLADQRLVEHYLRHVIDRHRPPSAVVSADGRVLAAIPETWVGSRVWGIPPGGGELVHLGLVAEPIVGGAGFVLTPGGAAGDALDALHGLDTLDADRPPVAQPDVELWTLGRHDVVCRVRGRRVELTRQQSEIVVLLLLHPDGLSGAELAAALGIDPPAVRVAMSRLRATLGDALGSRPYRLAATVVSDLTDTDRHLRAGRAGLATETYAGPLLVGSTVADIVAARDRLARRVATAGP